MCISSEWRSDTNVVSLVLFQFIRNMKSSINQQGYIAFYLFVCFIKTEHDSFMTVVMCVMISSCSCMYLIKILVFDKENAKC